MRTIRVFFSKKGEAAYISHLDLQRVMARAFRRSGLPVWYSQGFNPHIYMSFALPLPLMQESEAETVDFKTESEAASFDEYLPALNAALPRGLEASRMALPKHEAGEIGAALYQLAYPGHAQAAQAAANAYNQAPQAMVLRKTKRSEQQINLKEFLPALALDKTGEALLLRLPAGSDLNLNPALLTGWLEQNAGLPAASAAVLRLQVFTQSGEEFA